MRARTPISGLITVALTLGAVPAAAQTADPLSQAVRQSWDGAKRNIVESAELMPDADYDFRPIEQVRSFGQMLAHIAGGNYLFCASARGEKSPHAEDDFEKSARTKPQILKVLKESLAYCDAAYAGLTDASAAEQVDLPFGGRTGPRMAPLLGNITHLNEHYGNLVTYFRIKGMVPPSTARQRQTS